MLYSWLMQQGEKTKGRSTQSNDKWRFIISIVNVRVKSSQLRSIIQWILPPLKTITRINLLDFLLQWFGCDIATTAVNELYRLLRENLLPSVKINHTAYQLDVGNCNDSDWSFWFFDLMFLAVNIFFSSEQSLCRRFLPTYRRRIIKTLLHNGAVAL